MAWELQTPWRPGSQILAQYDYKSEHHPGKTLERVWELFYWYGLQRDVEDWCRQCEKCARRKSPKGTAQAPLVSRCSGYPLKKLHSTPWDQCQLLNLVSQVHPGHQRLFHEMERGVCYSKPGNKDCSQEKLVTEVISRYGAPEKIYSDLGQNLEAQLFQEICDVQHSLFSNNYCP